ncbi:MAG: hypothetical protein A2X61_16250 [Ignavibacteria bacterium GWB2_35_12]|nr:MAG: hypothetical protein A2X63_00295 [Ignavibacteria bacterium GWA2_35_8]OGU39965.1 MAG: hypothetical protein A2X61_16250 [Ignavibacteria bacterium GWB2_35_12]OGU86274.1 MAG: hypothetical protein A2220_10135 [Ignavibacteria bacterium RIFOXYA2_FULL_35_10]OGV21853.1 MAG: hypothetical protein A2475_11060 [Ignavibacteria bacterium RIFOXYC2_FULL_35_21]
MLKIQELKNIINAQKSNLIRNYGIKEIAIFGSYIRNENTEISDLDILVDFKQQPSLLKFINMKNYLTDLLGIKVDLVMKSAIKPALKNDIVSSSIQL